MPSPSAANPLEPPVRWRDWINLRANLSWIYEGPVPPGNRKGSYSPDHMGAWWLKRGKVQLKQKEKTVIARQGEWLIPWPGHRYQEFSEDAEILSIRFRAAWPDGKALFERGLSVKFAARRFPGLEAASEDLLRVARPLIPADPVQLPQTAIAFADFLEVNSSFLRWLNAFYAALCQLGLKPTRIGIRDERIVGALQRLDSLPLGARLREAQISEEAGLGVSQFVRLFRNELGETPKQYFDHRRRSYCREMVAGSAVPIKEIAFSLGFRRLSDFSAWFKHHYGAGPRRFRQEAMNDRRL